jgi:TonB family protein
MYGSVRHGAVFLAGLLAGFTTQAAAPGTDVQRFDISARVKVTAEGHVEDVQVRGEFDRRIVEHLDQAVRELKLRPAQRKGQPVSAETTMNFIAELRPGPGGSGTAITTRYTGHGPEFEKLVKPHYPTLRQTSRGSAAEVMLDVDIGSDGKVTDVRTHYVVVPEPGASGTRFEFAAKSAARKWLFNLERVDGLAVAAQVRVPIIFARNGDEYRAVEAARRKLYPQASDAPLDQRPLALSNATGLDVLD